MPTGDGVVKVSDTGNYFTSNYLGGTNSNPITWTYGYPSYISNADQIKTWKSTNNAYYLAVYPCLWMCDTNYHKDPAANACLLNACEGTAPVAGAGLVKMRDSGLYPSSSGYKSWTYNPTGWDPSTFKSIKNTSTGDYYACAWVCDTGYHRGTLHTLDENTCLTN
jgi:hypothetical protein